MLKEEPSPGMGGRPMRGRRPRPLSLAPADQPLLTAIARSRQLSWFEVQRARVVLAVADGIVPAISPRTVRQILRAVDLQPHRTRYWRTARLDARFQERAEKVLWCYGNAARLARRGLWVVATDEVPNFQVLERHPI